MANSNGWGDGAANNSIGWGQGANNAIAWGDSHAKSWAGATDIVGITTDPDAQAFITAAAITDPTQQTAIDTLVKGMKADGLWTKMKAVYPFVGGTASAHKWNLKDPRDLDAAFRLVFNGGWTHSANGATPNGTNGYADTKLNQSLHLSQTNGEIGTYLRTNTIGTFTDIGSYFAGTNYAIFSYIGSTTSFYARIATLDLNSNYNPLNSLGLFSIKTNGVNSQKFVKNGVVVATTTQSTNTLENINISIGAATTTIGAQFFSPRQTAFSYISDTLTNTEAANLYTRVQAFQTALSRQV